MEARGLQSRAMRDEQRDGERIPVLGELPGEVMVFAPMIIREIGTGGASVDTSFPLHLNSLHDLRLALGSISIVIKGRVVHSRISDVDPASVARNTHFSHISCTITGEALMPKSQPPSLVCPKARLVAHPCFRPSQ